MGIPTDGYTKEDLEFLEMLKMEPRIRFRPNPLKRANLEYCEVLAREIAKNYDLELQIKDISGGRQFMFRFFGASTPHDFARHMGELISRSGEFCPMADPEDPCYVIFYMSVFDHDRFYSNGEPIEDFQ